MTNMIEMIGDGFEAILGWLGIFANALLTAPAEGQLTIYVLLPLLGIAAGFGICKFGMWIIHSFFPGF